MLHDELSLGPVASIEELPRWLAESQQRYGVGWDLSKAKITTSIPKSKDAIRNWVRSLAT